MAPHRQRRFDYASPDSIPAIWDPPGFDSEGVGEIFRGPLGVSKEPLALLNVYPQTYVVAAVWQAFFIFNWGFDLFDLSSVRVPGPVPHPGFPKQQFTKNLELFSGGPGPVFPAPSRRRGGPGAPGPEIKNIYF